MIDKNNFKNNLSRYQTELPTIIEKRSEKFVTRDELVELMKWKLSVCS